MYFPSEKNLRYSLVFWTPIFLIALIAVYNSELYRFATISDLSVFGYLVVVLPIVLIGLYVWIWLQTGYKIKEGEIKIKSGPLRKTVKIEEINKLSTSNISILAIHPFSGPALSTERIEIIYGEHYDVINISPTSRTEFVKTLLAENPNIQTEENVAQSLK